MKLIKSKSHAFNKDVYLLGADENGDKYWLEAPSWDCNWYWGFGYIEVYSNNSDPSMARDITSHSHATNFMSEYFTSWNGSDPILKDQVFNEQEGWELSELFKQFYFLKEAAENFKRGNCYVATAKIPEWKKPELVIEINEILIPQVTKRILDILTPVKVKE